MENFNNDFLSSLTNDKYYLEKDLQRVYEDNNIGYREKIETVKALLKQIADITASIALFQSYTAVPQQPQSEPTNEDYGGVEEKDIVSMDMQKDEPKPSNGQSHKE